MTRQRFARIFQLQSKFQIQNNNRWMPSFVQSGMASSRAQCVWVTLRTLSVCPANTSTAWAASNNGWPQARCTVLCVCLKFLKIYPSNPQRTYGMEILTCQPLKKIYILFK